jgi:hypothetical protein
MPISGKPEIGAGRLRMRGLSGYKKISVILRCERLKAASLEG